MPWLRCRRRSLTVSAEAVRRALPDLRKLERYERRGELAIAAPRRYRNREHLRYVAQQACLVCGRKPSDPHHLGFTQPRALGRKVSDEFAVPLCRGHHRAVHRSRDERSWWRQSGIDPIKVARRLWKETRGGGNGRSEAPALPRTHGAAASSDQNNEGMSATAKPPEEARRVDVPT